jgi:TRAP-type C4-dicarboxylate transport system substrate-binding protein
MCLALLAPTVLSILAERSESMERMTSRSVLAALVLAMITAFAAAGCGGGGAGDDKAGGSGTPVVLRLANTYSPLSEAPAVEYFAKHVEELSGGNLRIDAVDRWGDFASDAEQQVVRDVSAGEVDLGWAGTRVFDTMGVKSFQALTAPMLVDSYALENAVIESGITDQMMQGLDQVGVVGLGVLADGLRKPIGVTGPILGPADWRGITFGTLRSDGQAKAIRALGATPAQVFGKEREEGVENRTIQGFEMNIWLYQANVLPHLAPYVTANVVLWPQMDVLLANPVRLAALTTKQRGWLEEAARDAAARSAALADKDARTLGKACESGARFAEASEADLAALETAFVPVYANLQQHPETKAFIERIQELKASNSSGSLLVIPPDCRGEAPVVGASGLGTIPKYLNGIYRYELTREDAIAVDPEAPDLDEYPRVSTVKMEDGRFSINDGDLTGTYTVQGDRITFDIPEFGYGNTFTFSVDTEGDLHLTPVQPMDPGDAFEFSTHPWTKIG